MIKTLLLHQMYRYMSFSSDYLQYLTNNFVVVQTYFRPIRQLVCGKDLD